MTQVGEGRGAVQGAGGPTVGEILAERYRLEQHVNTDSAGRHIWYGVDVILRRPVAIVIRYPGGQAATQMLQTAVEVSRIVHPNLVGVYDAIDEQARAYVVREWVDGASLRDYIASTPFDAERATAMTHAAAAAVTAVHSTGMTHGNIHPGTVLIGTDGRVVLADARADGAAPGEEDVRAVGALLYFALTGYWPQAEVAGPTTLPDALRDAGGGLAPPRQVRAGVPDYLDNLVMDLLDRRLAVPPADVLAGEFARIDAGPEEPYYADTSTGPLRLTEPAGAPPPKTSGRKVAMGVAGLLVVGIVGLLVGLNWLTGRSSQEVPPAADPGTNAPPATAEPTGDAGQPAPIALTASEVRAVDGPGGARDELEGVAAVIDGDPSTAWETHNYNQAPFGHIKPGMGILIDLGEPQHAESVEVQLSASGATAELLAGNDDPGATAEGDAQIIESYTRVGEQLVGHSGTTMLFDGFDPETTYRYLLFWITELPPEGDGYQIGVQEISVKGP